MTSLAQNQIRHITCKQCVFKSYFTTIETKNEQENPPAWTQEAYCLPRSKCSLCWWGGGGVPHPVMMLGGTPSSHGGGGVPHPVMVGGYPSRHGQRGYPHHPDLARGYSPPSRPGMGTPPTIQTWDGYPPHHPDLGTPNHPDLGWGIPYPDLGWGTPPPTNGEQTDILKYKYYLPSYYVRGW